MLIDAHIGHLVEIGSNRRWDPTEIRRQIAFCYGMMASIQLTMLWVKGAEGVNLALCAMLPVLAGVTCGLLGERVFRASSRVGYQRALSVLIIAFGIALVLSTGPGTPGL